MGRYFVLLQLIIFSAISLIAGHSSNNGAPATEQKVDLSDIVKSQIASFSRKEREYPGGSRKDDNTVPLYRYLRPHHGDHLYTIIDHNETIEGYTYEGVAGMVYKFPRSGTVPLHRYYNRGIGDHMYTTIWSELGGGLHGYYYEGIECYIYEKPKDGTRPLYRYWNGRDHFYTTNWSELKGDGPGWKLETIQGYVFPPK